MSEYLRAYSAHRFSMSVLFFHKIELEFMRAKERGLQFRVAGFSSDNGALSVSPV